MQYPRTDLALELQAFCAQSAPEQTNGVQTQVIRQDGITVTRVTVTDEEGERRLGKKQGTYITLEMENMNFHDRQQYEQCCRALQQELETLHTYDASRPVLVAGLGNRFITADALGPKAADKILVTRHMQAQLGEIFGEPFTSVCAVAPGVLGITGVETAEIVKGVADRVQPGLILVIDALAARDIRRLNTTVQLCDTGIAPGSGVGNNRSQFDRELFGVPVIAIGVPTVIDAVTMAYDAAYSVLQAAQAESDGVLSAMKKLSPQDLYAMVQSVMAPQIGTLTVTPKEVDQAMERIAKVIAGGVNMYLHKSLSIVELDSLTM